MSIADQLTTIAENQQKVYNAGHEAGHEAGYEAGKADYVGKYDEGFADGQQSEYDRFWDNFQQNGTRRNYPSGFAGCCWNDNTYNPKYEIIITSMAGSLFQFNSWISTTKVPITIDTTTSSEAVFLGCTRLVTIPHLKATEKVISFNNWFQNCGQLTTINFTDDSVIGANISFANSPNLTANSIDTIINALKDLTGQTAKKVQFHSDVLAAMTVEQLEAITAKNWTT